MSPVRRSVKRQPPQPKQSEPKPWEGKKCRDCGNVEEVTKFNTLDVHFRKPTLGKCPFYKEGKFCVLLSSPACKEHFKPKADGNPERNQSEG